MTEIDILKIRLIEKDIFIENILLEMKEIYELFDGLQNNAEAIGVEFLDLIKSMKTYE